VPAVYPDYPCEVCNGVHTLYYPGAGAVPDLSKSLFYTCTQLPVAMRITGWGSLEAGEEEAGRGGRVRVGSFGHRRC